MRGFVFGAKGRNNIGVDIVNDLTDGDAAILNDINDSEPISTESTLEAWQPILICLMAERIPDC